VAKVPHRFQHFIGDVTATEFDVVRYPAARTNAGNHQLWSIGKPGPDGHRRGHGGFSDTTRLQVLFSGSNSPTPCGRRRRERRWVRRSRLAQLAASGLDVTSRFAVGDGSFAETPKQTPSVPPGLPGPQGPNGDARADIIWMTVCPERIFAA
jgi:hypothetical protein